MNSIIEADLSHALSEALTTRVKNAGRQLFVRADKDVPYGMVMHVMDRVRGTGVSDVGLVATSATDVSADVKISESSGATAAPGSKKDNMS